MIRLQLDRKFFTSKNSIFTAISLAVCSFVYLFVQLFVPLPAGRLGVEIEIQKGTSTSYAFEILRKNGLFRDKNLMLIIAKITGVDRKIKAGYYSFGNNRTPFGVFFTLVNGNVVQNTVTIIEGETVWNVAEKLDGAGIMNKETFFRLNTDREFLASMNVNAPSLEGFLFPDTYKFPKGYETGKVLRAMVNNLRSNYSEEMLVQMERIRFSEKEILTLASIIEKEAVVDLERPIISAVYHNRLKRKMRLQADPTSIYGIKDSRSGVTRKDLRRRTPYNTYTRSGLPPGPIAAAGLKSIIAALYPADVPYLYFVSKNNREHHFSTTSREHFNAVNFYRSERRKLKNASGNDKT